MKIFKIISTLSFSIWALTGILIVLSIYNDTMMYGINIIMGFVFLTIAYYLYLKSKNSLQLINLQKTSEPSRVFPQFLTLELIFSILSLIVGLVALSGTISRVFYERLAVFG